MHHSAGHHTGRHCGLRPSGGGVGAVALCLMHQNLLLLQTQRSLMQDYSRTPDDRCCCCCRGMT